MNAGHRHLPRLPDDAYALCEADEDCTGRALVETGACLHHADEQARDAALAAMHRQRHYDLRGTTLSGETVQQILTEPYRDLTRNAYLNLGALDLSTVDEVCFDLRKCTIAGPVQLVGDRLLRGHLDLSDAAFTHMIDVSDARILARMVCENTAFRSGATFTRTRFEGPVWFEGAKFHSGAVFTEAVFSATTSFHATRATYALRFPDAVFVGRADFTYVRTAVSDPPGKPAVLDLSDTVFEQRMTADLEAHIVCDGARFEGGLDLRIEGGHLASLRGVRFGEASTVAGVLRVDPNTQEDLPPPHLLSLQDADVAKLSLTDLDLGHCLFGGAHNLDKLRIAGHLRFASLPPRGFRTAWNWAVVWRWSRREVICEEFQWRMSRVQHRHEWAKYWRTRIREAPDIPGGPAGRFGSVTGERLATLYRALRKAREDAKDEPGAGDFYYGEQEARRGSASTPGHERWLLTIYWALSGYGQRASRALAAFAVLLATLTVLLTGCGLADTAPTQRMTGVIEPAPPQPPQVITFDVTGQRGTATIPPATPGAQPISLDVTATMPTLPPPGQRWTAARAKRAVRTLVTSLVPVSADHRLTTIGIYLVLAGRVLGAFLLGLAVLAIRARVKR